MTPTLYLNLIMSSLGAEESQQPQKHTKTKKTKSHKTLNLHTCTQASTLPPQKHNVTQSTTRRHIYTKLTPPKMNIYKSNNTTNYKTQICTKTNKCDHSHQLAQQHPKFHHKMITNKNTT